MSTIRNLTFSAPIKYAKPQFNLIILSTVIGYILKKNPGHSDVICVVENVLNYFLWLNSSNG